MTDPYDPDPHDKTAKPPAGFWRCQTCLTLWAYDTRTCPTCSPKPVDPEAKERAQAPKPKQAKSQWQP